MAHYPKPFFRPSRALWYVQIDGKQVNLGPEKAAAFKAYHGLMQRRAEALPGTVVPPVHGRGLVVVLVDDYLDWCQKNRAPATYEWYKERLNGFCKHIDAALNIEQFRPHHVQSWADEHSAGSRRNLIRSVKRVMHWAEEQGRIVRSPLVHLKKPAEGRREQVVSAGQYKLLLGHIRSQEFRDLVTVSWETGCRPQESLRVEARHLDLVNGRWVFPASESKGKKLPRVVYLTPAAVEISRRLAEKHPQGVLFRGPTGKPWSVDAVNSRFCYLEKKIGEKVCLYAFRHSWINRMLVNGVDALTVAALSGHRNANMIVAHYGHLNQAPAYLAQQVLRAAG